MTARTTEARSWKAWLWRHEVLLLAVLVVEWLVFYHYGTTVNRRGTVVGFGTLDRQFDILRHSCEIGLLALAVSAAIFLIIGLEYPFDPPIRVSPAPLLALQPLMAP